RWRCPHLTMFHTLGIVKNNTAAPENEPELRIAHERWLAKVADRIIVPAERERQNLLTFYHAPAERVSIIPCGVDPDAFKPRDRLAARRMLGLAADAQIALYVGRFAPLKGIDRLFAAVARLKERFPRLHLLVIGGDGPDAQSTRGLQQLVHELGVGSRTSFLGRIDQRELPPYYSAADLLAVTSHYESFGLVVLEALACGTPVLSTPVGAVETIIRNGVNGEVVASPAAADVAEGMARILSRPPQRRASTRRIRASVENYSWDKVARAVRQSYAALLMDHDPAQATEYYTVSNVLQS
ncbi:MAG: glycosyltransferase, partial [Pseudomonadota bacterium]